MFFFFRNFLLRFCSLSLSLASLSRTQDEQSTALSGFEERLGGLVAENQALRAENDRLRRVY